MISKSNLAKKAEKYTKQLKAEEELNKALHIIKQEKTIDLPIEDSIRIIDWKQLLKKRY